MAGILIYSDNNQLACELITAARLAASDNSSSVKAVCINNSEQAKALAARGTDTYEITNPQLSLADTAAVASALKQAAEKLDCSTVLLSSNRRGKELAGRLAELLGAGCLTDVKSLRTNNNQTECVRNVLGGAAVATQIITSDKKVIALSPKAYPAAEQETGGSLNICDTEIKPSGIKVIETRAKAGDAVDIEAAGVLVVVGQGVENREDLPRAEKIARSLKGAVACSKPVATDKKWLGEERIVGLSGKICKPQLAIVLGVSGQVQFTVGIREAQTIISINQDENAYLNQMADYVWIADINEVLPELEKALG